MLGANILVADDDEVSARFLTRLLTSEGCRVRVVQTREEALAACASEPPDLVLIDLVSPRGPIGRNPGTVAVGDALRKHNITNATIAGGHGTTAKQADIAQALAAN